MQEWQGLVRSRTIQKLRLTQLLEGGQHISMSCREGDVEILAKPDGDFFGGLRSVAVLPNVAGRLVQLVDELFAKIQHDRFSVNDARAQVLAPHRAKMLLSWQIATVAVIFEFLICGWYQGAPPFQSLFSLL